MMNKQLRDVMTIYQQALNLFPYWTNKKIENWSTDCFKLLEEVRQGLSLAAFYHKLMRLSATLNDGHTLIYLPATLKEKQYFPFRLGIVDDELCIIETKSLDSALKNRSIRFINQQKATDFLTMLSEVYWKNSLAVSLTYFQDNPTFFFESQACEFIFEGGETVLVEYQKTPFKTATNEKQPPFWCDKDSIQIYEIANKVVIRLKHFMSPEVVTEFYRYLADYRNYEEIIFDVRDNLGGNSGYANEITQAFYKEAFATEKTYHQVLDAECYAASTMAFYQKDELEETADEWEKAMYQTLHHQSLEEKLEVACFEEWQGVLQEMPVTIIQNRGTYSSAENFIINFDNQKRARLVGETTSGSTGQPAWIKLATGGVFMVTAKQTVYPNGKIHHNVGVEPEIVVRETLVSRKSSEDLVLQYCLDH